MSDTQPQPTTSNTPDFNKLELEVLQYWRDNKTFEKSLEQTKDKPPFVFYDGPPFATGLPHYGSLLPSVIKDAIPRYQTMKGRYVRRRWGWDCHGLPIENIVEQQLHISGKKQIEEIGVEKFNQACRDNVLRYAKEWGVTIERIARWVEFENSYMTMQTSYMESVWWGLKQVWDKGLIYEDRKVLLYCSRCETPISNFEVAMDNSYRDVTEDSVFVKFRLSPRQRIVDFLTDDHAFMLAWTTTPWTLPGNTALNIGPDITYVLVEQDGNTYILAKDRLEVLDGPYEVKMEVQARSLEGLSYEPLYPGIIQDNLSPALSSEGEGVTAGRAHKVYAANFVTTTDGTGIVHNAAMYGEDDYKLAKEKDLPRVDMLDHKGQYLDMAPEHLRGVFFKDADKKVIADLESQQLLYKKQAFTHSYPHCHRCGTPLFYNALPAWFINIQKIKPQLLEQNESVNWYPEHLKHGRFKLGLENAPDWNISRNRYWATPLPFWRCENMNCKDVVCIASIAELQQKAINFSEVYPHYELRITDSNASESEIDLHKPYIDQLVLKCEMCNGEMKRVPEVVDCWVESGSMPFAELHYPFENKELFQQRFPSDFVVEYIPQTRAWFYVMHVMSTIVFGRTPFKNVVTTGTILGEDGTKMSKSKGNYPDANIVLEKYGADALRFYLLTNPVMAGEDANFSEKTLSDITRKVNMLVYNVWSFYRMYTGEKVSGAAPDAQHVLDRWIIARLEEVVLSVGQDLEQYNTIRAGRTIIDFVNDVSTWYLRRSRDRIKAGDEEAKRNLAVLGFVLAETARVLAPFMPYLSEFIYRDVTGHESVHLVSWPEVKAAPDQSALKQMELVREIVSLGLAARKTSNVSVRQALDGFAYQTKSADVHLSSHHDQLILDELNAKRIVEYDSLSDKSRLKGSVAAVAGAGQVIGVLLDTEITEELQREGLGRELERAVQDLRKKSGLKVGEIVDLYYNTQDETLEEVLLGLFDRKKTFVNQVTKNLEVEADFEVQATVSGRAIWLGIVKS